MKEKIDKATCPHCLKDFEAEIYGYGLRCPLCRGKIDVFPDDTIFVTTPFCELAIRGLKEMWNEILQH